LDVEQGRVDEWADVADDDILWTCTDAFQERFIHQ
jgi:hypothetical protein